MDSCRDHKNSNNSSSSSSSSSSRNSISTTSMRSIIALPPFLVKMYDIVDDPALDGVVCWGSTGQSFVVLDTVEFSRSVLPSHFKHNNFSSFVRQLNTYGFRKTGIDRWEFANEDFQKGKKHLLKNIRRRRSLAQVPQTGRSSSLAMTRSGLEDEVEMLRKDKELMKNEVLQLQEVHRMTAQDVDSVKLKIQSAEQRQKQMVRFLSKLLHNSIHVHGKEQKKISNSAPKNVGNYVELPSCKQFDAGKSCYSEGPSNLHENTMDGCNALSLPSHAFESGEVGVKSSSGDMHVEFSPIGFPPGPDIGSNVMSSKTDVVSFDADCCFIYFPDTSYPPQDNNLLDAITPVTESIATMPKQTLPVPASESQLCFGGPVVYDEQMELLAGESSSPLLEHLWWFQQDIESPNFISDYYLGSDDVLGSKEFGSKGKSPRK